MRPPKDLFYLRLIRDPAPEQFSEPNDPMMKYIIKINEEYFLGTDEYDIKYIVKTCKETAKWLEKVANYLKIKKKIGKRCT